MAPRKRSGAGGSGEGARERPKTKTESLSQTPSPAPSTDASPTPPDSQPEDERKVEADFAELLASTEKERDEYLALAQRTQADFENYRKRVAREAAEAETRGRAGLAKALVPVLDNLERALAAAEPPDRDAAPNHLAEGVRLVYEELAGILRNAGVESYSPAGEAFDPDWHEAMLTRPGEPGRVLEVFEKGYRLNGQVLRPARVVVGIEQEPSAGEPADGSAEG
jgi:molecular chaperone GrpE